MTTIYHNPRCSKSRQTLELLRERGIEPEIILYLETPPQPELLKTLLQQLDMQPRDLLRTKEAEYKDLNLKDPALDDDAIIATISRHPRLMERPIVVHSGRAVIGRPPENVLDLLQ